MNDQNSGYEAKTPLANVSSGKDSSESADAWQTREAEAMRVASRLQPHPFLPSPPNAAMTGCWEMGCGLPSTNQVHLSDDIVNDRRVPFEQLSTSDVFNNPERGISSRDEPESESSKLAEIRERLAVDWENDIAPHSRMRADVVALLGIIDSLKAESVDCVCGHNGKHHREEEDTGAARECSKCECTQFFNVHMALKSAASNMKAAILQRVRERAAEIENAYCARNDVIPVGAAAQLKQLATELEAINDLPGNDLPGR